MGKFSYFAAKKLNSYVTAHAPINSSWIKQKSKKKDILKHKNKDRNYTVKGFGIVKAEVDVFLPW